MNNNFKHATKTSLLILASALLGSGCSDDDAAMATYEVRVSNMTNGQPLTPVAVVVHSSGYSAWEAGATASSGLEMLAESGDPTLFLSDADSDMNVTGSAASVNGPFGPGTVETVSVQVVADNALQISVAAMLANTNDAFTGVTNVTVGDIAMGESKSMLSHVYDAGTEANTETAATMPGPAAGGEGFNAARDDTDFVSIHGGVVTSDDGLATSALDESHRWSGIAAKVEITRTQ